MHHRSHLVDRHTAVPKGPFDDLDDPPRRLGGRGRRLADSDHALRVRQRQVRESAPHVDSDAVPPRLPSPSASERDFEEVREPLAAVEARSRKLRLALVEPPRLGRDRRPVLRRDDEEAVDIGDDPVAGYDRHPQEADRLPHRARRPFRAGGRLGPMMEDGEAEPADLFRVSNRPEIAEPSDAPVDGVPCHQLAEVAAARVAAGVADEDSAARRARQRSVEREVVALLALAGERRSVQGRALERRRQPGYTGGAPAGRLRDARARQRHWVSHGSSNDHSSDAHVSAYASASRRVSSPGGLGSSRPSIARTGTISAAVPVRKHSSAIIRSPALSRRSSHSRSVRRASVSVVYLVMPGSASVAAA